jgi:hypothetical protein
MMHKLIYIANIIVAGWISYTCLFYPAKAVKNIFSDNVAYSELIRLIGSLWGAVFILSLLGLFFPKKMELLLIFQFIYKSLWLLFAAIPAVVHSRPFPKAMAVFFLLWIIALPFIIDWRSFFK